VGKSAARLTVDAGAAATRRELGPLAWLVLEELALHAGQDGEAGILTSAVGVRDLAGALGISKDTAARGVARLIGKRLVRREIERDRGGRFGSSRYVLALPTGLRRLELERIDDPPSPTRARRPRPRQRGTGKPPAGPTSQLSLIDGDG
jgi:DNA-binding MarR family transcriptional regulator